jgi:hypothetical protein
LVASWKKLDVAQYLGHAFGLLLVEAWVAQ